MKQAIENLTSAILKLANIIEANGFTLKPPQAVPRATAFFRAPVSRGSIETEIEITREGKAYSNGNGYLYSGSYIDGNSQQNCVLFVNSDKCDRVFSIGEVIKCHVRKDREKGKYGETKFWLTRVLGMEGDTENLPIETETVATIQPQSETLENDEDVPF